MSPYSRARLAAAVGAACLAGFQPSAHAGLIDYSYTGSVTAQGFDGCFGQVPCVDPLTGALGKAFSALVRIDTSTGGVVSFSFGISGFTPWAGSGGTQTHSATSLKVDLGDMTGSASYTSGGPAGGPVAIFDGLLDLVGPAGAFGNFIDGYATTFNVGAMTTRGGTAYICDPVMADFTVNLTAVSGTAVRIPTSTVAEPGTVALAGLAGLAALRSVRRRKAAAA